MRLVDADAALEKLRDMLPHVSGEAFVTAVNFAIYIFEDEPTVEIEKK